MNVVRPPKDVYGKAAKKAFKVKVPKPDKRTRRRWKVHPDTGITPKAMPITNSFVNDLWYAGLFAKPRCTYQPPITNSKISSKVGNWHASPPL